LRVSLFPSLEDPHVRPLETDWGGIAEELTSKRIVTDDKKAVPLFSPAEFREDYRTKKNVERVHFLVLDYDALDLAGAIASMERIASYRRILYSTHRHDPREPNGQRFRALVAIDRPVLGREWPSFWSAARADLAPLSDRKDSDASRAYFLPSCPADRAEFAFAESHDGAVIEVSRYIGADVPEAPTDGVFPVTPEYLRKLGTSLSKRKSLGDSQIGEILLLVAQGLPYATEGERDDVTWRLCVRLAKEIPEANAESLGAVFAASLSLMGAEAPTPAMVVEKFSRARTQNAERSHAAEDWRKARIRSIFFGSREEPYTDAEIATWGIRSDEWLLTFEKELFVAFDGSYVGPLVRAHEEALQWLAPAPFSIVRLREDGTIVYRTLKEMLVEQGKQITKRVVWIGGQGNTRYDRDTDTLHTFACPLRSLEPAYDANVDAFLAGIARSSKSKLETWLAACIDPEIALPMLWLMGDPGVGKSLLAAGVARLWTKDGPGDAHAALGTEYQDALLRCPLLLADEHLPRDFRGHVVTEKIRSLLTSPTHHVNKKYGMQGRVTGMVRLIAATNAGALSGLSLALKPEDFSAIAERILMIRCKGSPRIASDLAASFVKDDRIARHVLWLASKYARSTTDRFAVTGDAEDLVTELFVQSEWRAEVLEWIFLALADPQRHFMKWKYPAIVAKDGVVYIRRKDIGKCWSDYYNDKLDAAQQRKAAAAARDLINGGRMKFKGNKYTSVDPKMLEAYAKASEEEVPSTEMLEIVCKNSPYGAN